MKVFFDKIKSLFQKRSTPQERQMALEVTKRYLLFRTSYIEVGKTHPLSLDEAVEELRRAHGSKYFKTVVFEAAAAVRAQNEREKAVKEAFHG